MKRIGFPGSKPYEVLIGRGLTNRSDSIIQSEFNNIVKKVIVVTDNVVDMLHADMVCDSIGRLGIKVIKHVIPHGEHSKSISEYLRLIDAMGEAGLCRSDIVIALGGGVVGDLAGFAAATFKRGVGFIQMPTTLLAAVDSSVGGKNGIDTPGGKNFVGSFYNPDLVICDTLLLETLPEDVILDGCGEIVKYSILRGGDLFEKLIRYRNGEKAIEEAKADSELLRRRREENSFLLEEIIEECVAIKRDYVVGDEQDRGGRRFLNLGHTLGHAYELLSDFEMMHGSAVALGIRAAARIANRLGECSEKDCMEIEERLAVTGFDTESSYSAGDICRALFSDKKLQADKIAMILPKKPGECIIRQLEPERIATLLSECEEKRDTGLFLMKTGAKEILP